MNQTIRSALLSVYDKKNIIPLANFLSKKNIQIITTGGTAKVLEAAGIAHVLVEKFTQYAENFGGRMKTISFQISSGILYRRNHIDDELEAARLNLPPLDLIVCNFYPFKESYAQSNNMEDSIEEVDIGGPLMVRSAAKNFQSVTILTDVASYEEFMQHYEEHDGTQIAFRKRKAYEAFNYISEYDKAIVESFAKDLNEKCDDKNIVLRYGENPHQSAKWQQDKPISVLQGKELSYNNLLDTDVALRVISDLTHAVQLYPYAVCIIKHGNPCGVAVSKNPLEALTQAWLGDEISSFGSVVSINFELTDDALDFFKDKFIEVIIAPKVSADISRCKKNIRIIEEPILDHTKQEKVIRSIFNGVLIQDEDQWSPSQHVFNCVTKKDFPHEKYLLALFGIIANKYIKSNAIVLVQEKNQSLVLLSLGMGQPNRLDSLKRLAIPKALVKQNDLSECLLISDAFFPFDDCIKVAHEYGLQYIIQPGGSMKDQEVITTANALNISMIFTHVRHFRH